MGKRKRLRLSNFVRNILVISGLFQMAVLQFHIDMINNLFSSIIGFYLFAFLLFTIINILNGTNFTAKKSLVSIGAVILITGIQILFGVLFIKITLNEVATIEEVAFTSGVRNSILFLVISMGASIIACISGIVYYFKKSEVDMYLG